MSLLSIRDLSVTIAGSTGDVAALSGVRLDIEPGTVVGLVGESGGGKSMLARSVVGLLPHTASATGQVLFEGDDVLAMTGDRLRRHRGAGAAMCFQQPLLALNPVRRVGDQLVDRLVAHGGAARRAARARAVELLGQVGIREPERRFRAYPHEMSGGMAQRVMIALALACGPRLLLADEPTTGLDVTLAGEMLALFRREATENGRAVLLISHDIAGIAAVCDRLAVLYAGTLVEHGPAAEVLDAPRHPYTRGLLAAVPSLHGDPGQPMRGGQPMLGAAPQSCPFEPRCPSGEAECGRRRPALVEIGPAHLAACPVTAREEARG